MSQQADLEVPNAELQLNFNQDIERIIAGLSEGPESVVEKICDSLLGDLDVICENVREHGLSCVDGLKKTTKSYRENPERFAGHYVGYGLGKNWLELGFLEGVVVEALQKRFTSLQEDFVQIEPHSVDTMCGSVSVHDCFYMTERGAYQLSHTYAWFVQKRVDLSQ